MLWLPGTMEYNNPTQAEPEVEGNLCLIMLWLPCMVYIFLVFFCLVFQYLNHFNGNWFYFWAKHKVKITLPVEI